MGLSLGSGGCLGGSDSGEIIVRKKKKSQKKIPMIISAIDPKKTSNEPTFKGLNNLNSQECFANALLQCLYHLGQFRNALSEKTRDHSEGVLLKLNNLFMTMDETASTQEHIDHKKASFLREIQRNYHEAEIFKEEEGGDSRILFEAIKSLACGDKGPNEHDIFRLFSTGKMEKIVKCKACPDSERKEFHYKEDVFMLNISEDLFYKEDSSRNLFQPETQKRFCRTCKQQQEHSIEAELKNPPVILVLRIGESPSFASGIQHEKPKLPLTIELNGGKKRYNFVAGVYNTSQGHNGEHSVAYVNTREEMRGENMFLCYNDLNIRLVEEEKMRGFAKMMFYCEEIAGVDWRI